MTTFTKETYVCGIIVILRESINNETLTISSHNHSQEYERRTMDSNISVIFGTDFHVHLNTSVV
jgi:hypothetical protein